MLVVLSQIGGDLNIGGTNRITGDLYVNGKLLNAVNTQVNAYVSSKVPISFTTSRTVSINSVNYSAYDLDLNKYTKFITLDGRKIRQLRLRSWHASADFENDVALSYHMCMSDLNGLSIATSSFPYVNTQLDQLNGVTPTFYRNNFDTLTYLAPVNVYGSYIKVYCIFEDLL